MAAGFRSALPQLGYSAPPSQGGYRGLLAFWMGGACRGPAVNPPQPIVGGGGSFRMRRRPIDEEEELLALIQMALHVMEHRT
jgi:hypothetical protein